MKISNKINKSVSRVINPIKEISEVLTETYQIVTNKMSIYIEDNNTVKPLSKEFEMEIFFEKMLF